jgi:hypothetical protein
MTPIVWENIALTVPFIAAFIGVPLWMTFRRPETAPDHAPARAYLTAKANRGGRPAAARLAALDLPGSGVPEALKRQAADARLSSGRAA